MKYLLPVALAAATLSLAPSASAAIYTVTNPSGSSANGTLAWALEEALNNPGTDTIRFSIGTGPVTVEVPYVQYINHPVIIDGTTQPGYSGNPIVFLQSASIFESSVFTLAASSEVRGLVFAEDTFQGAVRVLDSNCIIENCWFGIDQNMVPAPGFRGIDVGAWYSTPMNVKIKNCIIGNQSTGIRAQNATDLQIIGCSIGTNPAGTQAFPITNSGIVIINCTGTYIGSEIGGEGNIIANCGDDGVGLLDSADTVILDTRIYNVGQLAIDHGQDDEPYPFSDFQDADIATGGEQNAPYIQSVVKSGGTVRFDVVLDSTPSTQFLVEFYASTNPGTFGSGQGQYRVGIATPTTDAFGYVAFDINFVDTLPSVYPVYYSATATRFNQSWGTSEFSPALLAQYASISTDSNPGNNPAWIPSGIDSGPEHGLMPDSIDDVDIEKVPSELRVIVRPSTGRFRVAGWTNPAITNMVKNTAAVYRGKFYIYTSNPAGAPLNTVPNFRLRLDNEGVTMASNTYEYATTGNSPVPHEPFYGMVNFPDIETRAGQSLRPTDSSAQPSLYRIDFVPPPVPAGGGSRIGATFESYAGSDAADGTLALTEVQVAAYTQLSPVEVAFVHSNDPDFYDAFGIPDPGISTTLGTGAFNIEADFQPGRRQALDLAGEVPGSELAQIFEPMGTPGTIIDTLNTPENKIGVGILNIQASNNATAPRIKPDTGYAAIFVASSDMPAEPTSPGEPVQGTLFFQLQTGGGAMTSRLELIGPAPFFGPPGTLGRTIAAQALPGKNSKNMLYANHPLPAGERGSAYFVILPPLLSEDIRKTTPGNLGPLASEPGPGVNAPSYRDILMAVNAIEQPTTMRLTPDLVVPWAPPNRARVRYIGVILFEVMPIDDGGYIIAP